MNDADPTLRIQRLVVLGIVVLTALVFWTGATDSFGLPKATVLWLGTLALIALSVWRAGATRRLRVPTGAFAVALVAVAVTATLTTLLSDTLALSVVGEFTRYTGLATYLSYVVVALHVLRVFDVDEAALALRVVTGTALVVGVYGLLQVLDADPYHWVDKGFSSTVGTLGNSNLLAGWLAIAIPASVWGALTRTHGTPWRLASAFAAVLGLVVASESDSFQGPAAALPATLLVVAVWATTEDARALRARVGGLSRPLRIGAAAVVALAVLGALPLVVSEARDGIDSGMVERGDFWRAGLEMFTENPIVGTGFDTYGQHFLAARSIEQVTRATATQAESAHNVPLNLLAGGGLLVGLAWLALLAATAWSLVRGLRRLAGEERLLLGGLGAAWVAYVLQSLVSFDVPAIGVLHVVLAGSIVAIGTPVAWRDVALGSSAPVRGRRSRRPSPLVALQVAGVVVTLVVAWFALRPLRADLAAGDAGAKVRAGDLDAAAASLDSATDLAPWQGRYHLLLAQVNERRSEVFQSIGDAEEAARREPGSSRYALLAANLNARYRTPEDAVPWYDAALERDPRNPDVLGEVAAALAPIDPERALRLAEQATETVPTSYIAWYGLGVVLEESGDEDGARAAYERSLEIAGNYLPASDALQRLDGEAAGA
jgi:O-antigen ligase